MTRRLANFCRGNRALLGGLMIALSMFVWLDVSSSRNNVLHAIGKLGIATKGYGSANVILLLLALTWSVVGGLLRIVIYEIRADLKSSASLFAGVLLVLIATAFLGIIFDYQLSISFPFALAVTIFELIAAALVAWLSFFGSGNQTALTSFVGSCSFGLFALIAITSLALSIYPRVSYRF